jgi:precorrin-6B methylase 2
VTANRAAVIASTYEDACQWAKANPQRIGCVEYKLVCADSPYILHGESYTDYHFVGGDDWPGHTFSVMRELVKTKVTSNGASIHYHYPLRSPRV